MGVLGPDGAERRPTRRLLVDLLIFNAVAFGITWLVVGLYVWNAEAATSVLGPMRLGAPAFYVAVYAPTVAAVAVTFARYGRAGLADLFASLFRIRARWPWIALSLLAFPGLWLAVELIRAAGTGALGSFDVTPWLVTLPLVIVMGHALTDPGAFGEELGWRGFMLPRLLEFTDARSAGLILGFIWAIWHLPAFFVGSLSQSAFELVPFILRVMAFSMFMTWIFVNTRGSVLWAGVVPHMMFNATPDAGITPIGWIAIAAGVVILVLAGKHMRGWGRPKAELPQSALLNPSALRAGGRR